MRQAEDSQQKWTFKGSNVDELSNLAAYKKHEKVREFIDVSLDLSVQSVNKLILCSTLFLESARTTKQPRNEEVLQY